MVSLVILVSESDQLLIYSQRFWEVNVLKIEGHDSVHFQPGFGVHTSVILDSLESPGFGSLP
jgi:hypothetical protein